MLAEYIYLSEIEGRAKVAVPANKNETLVQIEMGVQSCRDELVNQ